MYIYCPFEYRGNGPIRLQKSMYSIYILSFLAVPPGTIVGAVIAAIAAVALIIFVIFIALLCFRM